MIVPLSENNIIKTLEFHHIGLLVDNIQNSVEHYSMLFGKENISSIIPINSQKVNVHKYFSIFKRYF